ncbi:MAG: Gfo/Idh/MocA family oxidoreductase [Bryobacterales bacterium]|nr:Gfo/Idh/MocA family oxidoreductase [Bryobacteraceae bacterium]MDW8131779.1 Gfo/Idh/MocA family oxidoreductase [Bryobacterales bacterium]
MLNARFPRRCFFFGSLLAGAVPPGGFSSVPSLKALGYKSPNEKLNLAAIGCGGQPFADLRIAAAGGENVVALADVDWERGAEGFKQWPKAERYKDFRRMLDRQGREIDAVIIGTPDHTHIHCSLACMQLGKHVYLEKPLARTSWEARVLTRAAEKYKVATQMGNQGYSHDATRVACEIIWSGEIGEVREVHAWTGIAGWPQGMKRIPPPTPVPDTLDWDLWLGGAAWRPFTAGDEEYRQFVAERNARIGRTVGSGYPGQEKFGFYLPFNWRGFYDFGSGLIGDWGVHILGPANWALQLAPEYLISVECVKRDSRPEFTFPDELVIRYEFAARPGMPPVTVYWYHHGGGDAYLPPGMTVEEARKIPGQGPQVGPPRGRGGFMPGSGGGVQPTAPPTPGGPPGAASSGPQAGPPAQPRPRGSGYNCIFVGTKGYLGTSGRGEDVGLLPGKRWAEYKLPDPYLPRSPGASTGSNHAAHIRDWIRACKGGAPACSNFSIAGPFCEWLLLGAVAVHYEGKLLWDHRRGEFSNHRDANRWLKPVYRKGWQVRL